MRKVGVLARWRDRLPVTPRTPALTLGEGDTPLVDAPTLARDVGCAEGGTCNSVSQTIKLKSADEGSVCRVGLVRLATIR